MPKETRTNVKYSMKGGDGPLEIILNCLACFCCCSLGAYHSGVQINGREYTYGRHTFGHTGVFWHPPKQAAGAVFKKSISLGWVDMSWDSFREMLRKRLEPRFIGREYNLLSRNCNHFTEAFVKLFGFRFPSWINRIARVGSFVSCCVPVNWIAPPIDSPTSPHACPVPAEPNSRNHVFEPLPPSDSADSTACCSGRSLVKGSSSQSSYGSFSPRPNNSPYTQHHSQRSPTQAQRIPAKTWAAAPPSVAAAGGGKQEGSFSAGARSLQRIFSPGQVRVGPEDNGSRMEPYEEEFSQNSQASHRFGDRRHDHHDLSDSDGGGSRLTVDSNGPTHLAHPAQATDGEPAKVKMHASGSLSVSSSFQSIGAVGDHVIHVTQGEAGAGEGVGGGGDEQGGQARKAEQPTESGGGGQNKNNRRQKKRKNKRKGGGGRAGAGNAVRGKQQQHANV